MAVNISNLFDANFYSAANPDLAAAGLTTSAQLLSHFQAYGLNEGRAFSPLVDLNFYRASNPDLASFNNQQALDHLENYGISEGRRFSDVFDLNFYRAANSDLSSLNNEQLFQHLETYGLNEGREFSQFFDPNYYKASNPDLGQAGLNSSEQLLQHFDLYGLKEGRKFDPAFDVNYYRSVNRDLAPNLTNKQLLDDFETNGLDQGRISSPTFDVKVYLANNADLMALCYNNQQAYTHFVLYGQNEGRAGNYYQANTLDTARDITSSLLTTTWTDFVGDIHNNDYYKFNLENSTDLTIALNNLNANVNVQLIRADNNGNELIDSSDNGGAASEAINRRYLQAGTYYIRVSSDKGSNTNYDLNVSLLGSPALSGAPNNQSWLTFGTIPNAQPTVDPNADPNADPNTNPHTNVVPLPTQTGSGGFDSTQDPTITGGYTSYNNDGQLNPQFPTLDHNTGFTIDFDAKVNSESHNSNDQAGFDVVALDNYGLGIELGFWNNQIWAKQIVSGADGSSSLTHNNVEQVTRDTTVATHYELSIVGNTYKLFADGSPILTGNTQNYTPYNTTGLAYNPYQKPNYFFIGDDSASAGANVDIPYVAVSKT